MGMHRRPQGYVALEALLAALDGYAQEALWLCTGGPMGSTGGPMGMHSRPYE